MIVTDGPAGCLPDVLLRIQIRSGDGKAEHFEPRVGCQQLSHQRAFMPRGTIPASHGGRTGGFVYFNWLFGQFLNAPP